MRAPICLLVGSPNRCNMQQLGLDEAKARSQAPHSDFSCAEIGLSEYLAYLLVPFHMR